MCAYKLRKIINDFQYDFDSKLCNEYLDLFGEDHLSKEDILSIYIASQYICGNNISLRKYVLVYATLIKETLSSSYLFENDSVG